VDGLSFPLQINIPKFEAKNPTISVNVLSLDERDFCVEYCSPELGRLHHVNLVLLGEDGTDKRHYICIRNMSRLVGDRTKYKARTYACNECLHPFKRKDLLNNHISNCLRNLPHTVKYPDPQGKEKSTIKFTDYKKLFRLPFFLVCDFESFLTPIEDDDDKSAFINLIYQSPNR